MQNKTFKLIEHLAEAAFQKLKKKLPPEVQIEMEITKISPPIKFLKGGISFTLKETPS